MGLINYELKPTRENLKRSILTDMVGRNNAIARFIEILDATEGNISIALDDSWGNGKTFFVKQTQLVLQSYNSSDDNLTDIKGCMSKLFQNHTPKNYFPIYYDAWSNDNDTDPILSIIFIMLQDLACLQNYEVNDRKMWDTITNGLEVISTTFGGPRVKQFLDSVKGKNILDELKKCKETDKILNELFDVVLEKSSDDTRIVFFVDELDRCRPDFAVRLLERIKHYFLNEKIVFVFSINSLELQHTIKRHYGNDFNADKYLRRFFDFTIPLPAADMQKFYESINFSDNVARYNVAKVVMQKYKFSLREITRYLQYLKVAVPESYEKGFESQNFFYFEVLVPFLIGLKIHDLKKYNEFVRGENFKELMDIIQLGNPDWYCRKFLSDVETFKPEQAKQGYKLVSLEEKIRPVYECLFVEGGQRNVRMITQNFSANDRKKILGTISLMQSDKI